MIDYFEGLSPDEQENVKRSIQLLYRQTFLLERKYDRKNRRVHLNRDYYQCEKHLEFVRAYFALVDVDVAENSQMGVIFLRGEQLIGEKLPKLATLYILILKLIYDEQMSAASSQAEAVTTLGEIHEKLGGYRILKKQPSETEVRRTIGLLKKYQLVEPLDVLEELDGRSRLMIYPSILMVLQGDDARAMVKSFEEGEDDGDESDI